MRFLRGQLRRSFFLSRNLYYDYYIDRKEQFRTKHPDWPDGRVHGAAIVLMHKLFFSHFYELWREVRGLPLDPAYIFIVEAWHDYLPPFRDQTTRASSRGEG